MPNDAMNAPPGEVEARLDVALKDLRDLRGYAGAVNVTERDADAQLLEMSLTVVIAVALRMKRVRLQARYSAHRAAVVARNDELGIPNCDHLIPDPECPECTKNPADRSLHE